MSSFEDELGQAEMLDEIRKVLAEERIQILEWQTRLEAERIVREGEG